MRLAQIKKQRPLHHRLMSHFVCVHTGWLTSCRDQTSSCSSCCCLCCTTSAKMPRPPGWTPAIWPSALAQTCWAQGRTARSRWKCRRRWMIRCLELTKQLLPLGQFRAIHRDPTAIAAAEQNSSPGHWGYLSAQVSLSLRWDGPGYSSSHLLWAKAAAALQRPKSQLLQTLHVEGKGHPWPLSPLGPQAVRPKLWLIAFCLYWGRSICLQHQALSPMVDSPLDFKAGFWQKPPCSVLSFLQR